MKRIKLFKYLSLVLLILSTIFIYPNFEKKLPEWWKYFFPQNSINLGLDLKGGIFIVLGVDETKINPIILKEEEILLFTVCLKKCNHPNLTYSQNK